MYVTYVYHFHYHQNHHLVPDGKNIFRPFSMQPLFVGGSQPMAAKRGWPPINEILISYNPLIVTPIIDTFCTTKTEMLANWYGFSTN